MERLNSFQRVRLRRERQAAEEIGIQKGLQAGLAKGIEQGIEQGLLKGEALALQRLLAKRFGPLPDRATHQIASATTDQIDLWIDRVLEAQSLNDVFRSS